jgi:hypothetical protein
MDLNRVSAAFRSFAVMVWGGVLFVAVAAEYLGAEIVREDYDDVWRLGLSGGREREECGNEGEGAEGHGGRNTGLREWFRCGLTLGGRWDGVEARRGYTRVDWRLLGGSLAGW